MSYLVPCPKCGTSLPVELGMSGETLRCPCGSAVEVPTLRVLRDMPRTDDVDEGPGWTWRHGVMVIGAMILVFGLAMGIYLVRNQSAVNPDRYWEQWYANAKPLDAWRLWTYYQRDGIAGGMNPTLSPTRIKMQEMYFGQMAANLKLLYAFGDLVRGPDGEVRRTRGIVHTIKDGIVIENANLMRDVELMVRDAKRTMPMDVVRSPWVAAPTRE